jgi:hypothetical protein
VNGEFEQKDRSRNLAQSTTLITGTACGGAGGLLLGMVLIKIIRWTMGYLKNKAAIS